MTPDSEDSVKNYYVVCLDIIGFESILKSKDYEKVEISYRDFERRVKRVIPYRSTKETTYYFLIGDALYFVCEQIDTALHVVKSFGINCITKARGYSKGNLEYEIPFMFRGGISFGAIPILQYYPNDDKGSYCSFNAVGLPVKSAYLLSEKPKGVRVAIDKSVEIQDYKKYFYIRRDLCKGNEYCDFLWPLLIFEQRGQNYIKESLNAFWDLYEKNRGEHELHYESTLALLWKAIDKTPEYMIAQEFFKIKKKEFINEIKYISLLKDYDIYPSP